MADENANKTWQEKADALKVLLQPNGMYVQIAYESNDKHDCEPIPLPYKLDHDEYPVVVEAPTGMNHPKFDWRTLSWHEIEPQAQGARISSLEKTTSTLATNVHQLQQDHTKAVQADEANSKQMSNMQKLLVQSNANQAQLMAMVNQLVKANQAAKPAAQQGGTN